MKSNILISRIVRVIETDGAVAGGAALAVEYSEAVSRLNARLDAVQTAVDAKQVSDAVRIMEDSPRLLDEVSSLDFSRLADWVDLCSRNNWAIPSVIDKTLLERVLILNEDVNAVEPVLRMYRKAMLTNNNKAAVISLRRLVQIDSSQDWKSKLLEKEEDLHKQMVSDYLAAKAKGNQDEIDRIAQDFAETDWAETPRSKVANEIRLYLAEKESARINAEGIENLSIIRRCMSERWNCTLAYSMLQAIDGLVRNGFSVPVVDRDLIDSCRSRCEGQMKAEAEERRWRDLCEKLRSVIRQADTAAIRDVLSSPEFLAREPDKELVRQAHEVISREEAARKRKRMVISFSVLVVLFIVLGGSGLILKRKLFDERCEGEAVKLAALAKGPHAVDRLEEALRKLENEDPDVFADPRVNVFDGRLKTMRDRMIARTNEISNILAELREIQGRNWDEGNVALTSRFDRIARIIDIDDDALRAEYQELVTAWTDFDARKKASARAAAEKASSELVSRMNVTAGRLNSELVSQSLAGDVVSCKKTLEEWRKTHEPHAPDLLDQVLGAEKALDKAVNRQSDLASAVRMLHEATSAKNYLMARKSLLDSYSGYEFVKGIGEHPVTPDEVEDIVNGTSSAQKVFADMLSFGVNVDGFKSFISDSVLVLKDIPSYYSLYGIYERNGRNYFAISKDKPIIKDPFEVKAETIVEGELLDLVKCSMTPQISGYSKAGVEAKVHPSSEEIRSVIDKASSPNLSLAAFERDIYENIEKHLEAVGQNAYFENETAYTSSRNNEFAVDRYPAIRRIQLLHIYFMWLKDGMHVLPKSGDLAIWLMQIESLSQPIHVVSVSDDMSWACMRETRVRKRNAECAKLLAKMASAGLVRKCREWRKSLLELKRLESWEIEFVGSNQFDPGNSYWMKDRSVVIPCVKDGVKPDHPLYVVRKENGRLILRRALVPYINKSGATVWGIAPGMTGKFVTGDPLFQIVENGKCIDAEASLHNILKAVPEDVKKQYARSIPLFEIKGE